MRRWLRRARVLVAPLSLALAGTGAAGHDGGVRSAVDDVLPHVYERDASGAVVERRMPDPAAAVLPAVPMLTVSEPEIARMLRRADAAREADLEDVARAPKNARLVPEDLTRRARVHHVAVEKYTDATFAELLARIGRVEGFAVVARVAPGSPWARQLARVPNLTVAELPGVQYLWTEDVLEIGVDGTFHMTARVGDRALVHRALFVDRVRRFYPRVPPADLVALGRLPVATGETPGEFPLPVMRDYSDIMFMIEGLVESDSGQAVAAELAAARDAPLREAMTYLEGGNVLLGTRPDGSPFALVGRDSAALARAVLERHRGRAVPEAEAIDAMAKDLGIERGALFLVEQPWVFHLDMAMTLLAPGTVVLNDSLEAFRLEATWLRDDHDAWRPRRETAPSEEQYQKDLELWRAAGRDLDETIQKLAKYTERFARYEARALADLQAAGLTVIRMAARFPHPTRPWDRDIMNFVNGEAGTNARGSYLITQGGDPRAERYAAERLLAPGTGLDRVYMAPPLVSRDSLWEKGGVSCRVKVEGDVVPFRAAHGG